MKNRKWAVISTLIIGISCFTGFALQKHNAKASNEISVTISSVKHTFQLGELIPIEAKIRNNSSIPIYLDGNPDNLIKIKISFNGDKDYKLYAPQSRFFAVDGASMPTKINPQENLIVQSSILWNYKPSVSHLNSDAAKPLLEGKIRSDYAFPKAGVYFVKGSIYIQDDGKVRTFESEPIKITIEEPVGEDLEVWNKIKDNGDFAYFIQEGELTRGYHKPGENEKFLNEIEQIISQYPNSLYAESLRQSLAGFRANEIKRQEAMEKLNPKQVH